MVLPIHPPVIVHHMAALNGDYSQNSLEAIHTYLDSGIPFIKIKDITHAGQDYVLVYDASLHCEATAGV